MAALYIIPTFVNLITVLSTSFRKSFLLGTLPVYKEEVNLQIFCYALMQNHLL